MLLLLLHFGDQQVLQVVAVVVTGPQKQQHRQQQQQHQLLLKQIGISLSIRCGGSNGRNGNYFFFSLSLSLSQFLSLSRSPSLFRSVSGRLAYRQFEGNRASGQQGNEESLSDISDEAAIRIALGVLEWPASTTARTKAGELSRCSVASS